MNKGDDLAATMAAMHWTTFEAGGFDKIDGEYVRWDRVTCFCGLHAGGEGPNAKTEATDLLALMHAVDA